MPQRNVATHFTFEQQRQEINLLASDFWTQKQTVDNAAGTYLKADGSVATTAALTLGGNLVVPNAFTINPDSGNGTVTISGNLQVDGTTTTLNSTTLEIADKNLIIAKNAANDAAADGAGITIDSGDGDKTLNWVDSSDNWTSSESWDLASGKAYHINNISVLNSTTLGSGVVNSSLTSVGTLTELTVNGNLDVDGSSTFGANGSITSGGNFTLSGNGLTVTGSTTAVGEFKGATQPTVQITQTTDNTDLQLRANATGGLIRTATAFPLVLGTSQEERLRIHESNAFVTVNHGNAETNSALILSKADAGYAKLEFDVGTSQKAYVELDASENLIHYGAAGVNQQFYAGGISRLTIADGGNVGIGTGTDPVDRKLHVKSSGLIAKLESTTANSLIMFATPTNETAGTVPNIGANDNDLEFTTGNLSRLKIQSDGKVAIGDHTATKRLDIRGTGNQGILVGSTDNNGAQIIIDGAGGGDASGGNYGGIEVLNNGDFTFRNHDASQSIIFGVGSASGANNTLVLDSSQNATFAGGAGIGTAPATGSAQLDVVGTIGGVRAKVTTNNGGYLLYQGLSSADTSVFTVTHNGRVTGADGVYDSNGNLRSVPQNTQASAYDLVASDNGKHIFASGNVTIPPNIFSAGDIITVVNNTAGDINIVAGAGQGIYNSATASTAVPKTLAQRGMATILITNSSTCYVSGTSLTDP